MRMVDTDVLVDVLRGHAPALAWFAALTELPGISGFVLMELLSGCADNRRVHEVDRLVAPLTVVWPTEADCQRALADFHRYHLPHSIGMLDALVAACAVGTGAVLYSFNTRHFRAISDLVVESPYVR